MQELRQMLGSHRVSTRIVDRLAYAHDASLYRLVPEAVVRPATTEHVQALIAWCSRNNRHLTFRTGGTSLSGQAVTTGILVDLSRDWRNITVLDQGQRVQMQPGITGARVNAHLRRYGRKIGPDPASIIAAMIGGIVANNASGMCCGTSQNSYNTLNAMCYVLADGTYIDTSAEDADRRLLEASPLIHAGLCAIRDEMRADSVLVATIKRKYAIKNTIGYSLNAFLDEDMPAKIIARLLVGSEGTLGFIERVTLNTIIDAAVKHTAMIVFPSLVAACDTVPFWRNAGAAAVELMDDASLRSFADLATTPLHLQIKTPGAAALLVEFHDIEPPTTDEEIAWTTDPHEQMILWKLRKGLMPSIGAMRPAGYTMINEDVAVPPQHLAALVKDVRTAFDEFDYDNAIIFGHAKDGNIHFVVNQSFESEKELDRYARFMDRIAEIVVDTYGGSLKAEHGTGRNMSPYVEKEWGSTAYSVMKRVKVLLDPKMIFSPDVVLNDDPRAHVKNIKSMPSIGKSSSVDLCIECGFCEHVCPSKDLTLTPRQRIVLQRERVINRNSPNIVKEIDDAYIYDGIATCAGDSICSTVCPVGIDTGAMIKEMRSESTTIFSRSVAMFIARNMLFLNTLFQLSTRFVRRFGSPSVVHSENISMPDIIYLQTCPSKWVGKSGDEMSLGEAVVTLAKRSGLRLLIMNSDSLCCGQPFASKGHFAAADDVAHKTVVALKQNTLTANVPVFLDTSTCASALIEMAQDQDITIIDQTLFAELILQRLSVIKPVERIVVHPGCGIEKLKATSTMMNIVRACALNVVLPPSATCCGMGGDRGIFHPELVASALRDEVSEIPKDFVLGVSSNALCEYALRAQTGIKYQSLIHLVEQTTRY